MVEQTFSIDRMEQAVSLFGSFDENIKLIEKEFQVRVISRGSEIKIQGDEEYVDKAKRAINSLLTLINKGDTLTEQNVRYVISLVKDGNDDKLVSMAVYQIVLKRPCINFSSRNTSKIFSNVKPIGIKLTCPLYTAIGSENALATMNKSGNAKNKSIIAEIPQTAISKLVILYLLFIIIAPFYQSEVSLTFFDIVFVMISKIILTIELNIPMAVA